jgi:hypothetical protein
MVLISYVTSSLLLLLLVFIMLLVSAHRANVHHVVASVSHDVVGINHIVGHCLKGTITLDPTFGSFIYLIRTDFTLGESVSLVKVFRLFRLE